MKISFAKFLRRSLRLLPARPHGACALVADAPRSTPVNLLHTSTKAPRATRPDRHSDCSTTTGNTGPKGGKHPTWPKGPDAPHPRGAAQARAWGSTRQNTPKAPPCAPSTARRRPPWASRNWGWACPWPEGPQRQVRASGQATLEARRPPQTARPGQRGAARTDEPPASTGLSAKHALAHIERHRPPLRPHVRTGGPTHGPTCEPKPR